MQSWNFYNLFELLEFSSQFFVSFLELLLDDIITLQLAFKQLDLPLEVVGDCFYLLYISLFKLQQLVLPGLNLLLEVEITRLFVDCQFFQLVSRLILLSGEHVVGVVEQKVFRVQLLDPPPLFLHLLLSKFHEAAHHYLVPVFQSQFCKFSVHSKSLVLNQSAETLNETASFVQTEHFLYFSFHQISSTLHFCFYLFFLLLCQLVLTFFFKINFIFKLIFV